MVVTEGSASASGGGAAGFWLLFLFMLAATTFLLRQGARSFWRLRTITDTPTARIRSAAQGYVELAGQARPHLGPTQGPLTGRPCLWYRYRIEKRGGGKDKDWIRIEGGDCDHTFLLDDGSGQCVVEPAGAHMRLRRVTQWTGPDRHPRGRASASWLHLGGHYRYIEERIEDGDPLYCLGRFETPLRGPAERERLQRALLKVWKQDPQRMARFDTNGDGEISLDEWEQARTEASALAARAEDERTCTPTLARLKATGEAREPFVISAHEEEELASGQRWQMLGYTIAFVAAAAITALMALHRFGG
jgi:hypothetical protein